VFAYRLIPNFRQGAFFSLEAEGESQLPVTLQFQMADGSPSTAKIFHPQS